LFIFLIYSIYMNFMTEFFYLYIELVSWLMRVLFSIFFMILALNHTSQCLFIYNLIVIFYYTYYRYLWLIFLHFLWVSTFFFLIIKSTLFVIINTLFFGLNIVLLPLPIWAIFYSPIFFIQFHPYNLKILWFWTFVTSNCSKIKGLYVE
jgi:hypothetical protein